jgi:hypothetical protein
MREMIRLGSGNFTAMVCSWCGLSGAHTVLCDRADAMEALARRLAQEFEQAGHGDRCAPGHCSYCDECYQVVEMARKAGLLDDAK